MKQAVLGTLARTRNWMSRNNIYEATPEAQGRSRTSGLNYLSTLLNELHREGNIIHFTPRTGDGVKLWRILEEGEDPNEIIEAARQSLEGGEESRVAGERTPAAPADGASDARTEPVEDLFAEPELFPRSELERDLEQALSGLEQRLTACRPKIRDKALTLSVLHRLGFMLPASIAAVIGNAIHAIEQLEEG